MLAQRRLTLLVESGGAQVPPRQGASEAGSGIATRDNISRVSRKMSTRTYRQRCQPLDDFIDQATLCFYAVLPQQQAIVLLSSRPESRIGRDRRDGLVWLVSYQDPERARLLYSYLHCNVVHPIARLGEAVNRIAD